MPGGRLTGDDRHRIAAGLVDGLGYAEIARQLGRPTSTVSREVARNGGPAGYRPEHAHLATGRRARRRGPAPAADQAGTVDDYGRDLATVRDFAEQFATMMVESGLPRMAARVLACLVTTDAGALTAAELVRHLRVSPASVSKAIGYLEGLEILQRERGPRQRRECYFIDDDTWLRTWLTSARTNARWAEAAQQGAELLDAATPAGARLDLMARFFTSLSDDMAGGTTAAVFSDTLTVLAALVHAQVPLSAERLAAALGWELDRVTDAVASSEKHPDIADPVALRHVGPDSYAVEPRADRLTKTQREALSSIVA